MNASDIINPDMTLEEKLDAIEKAMQNMQEKAVEEAKKWGREIVPVDPSVLTICDGCE